MTTPRPPQPPVMQLIEQRRRRAGLSFRRAGKLAGLSDSRWIQLEHGYRDTRLGAEPAPAPDRTLARMALAVRVTPDELRPFSAEAAGILTELIEEREANGREDADAAAEMVDIYDRGRRLSGRDREDLESKIAGILRDFRDL